jgi:ATP-binding cassette, subfamily B, bacterial
MTRSHKQHAERAAGRALMRGLVWDERRSLAIASAGAIAWTGIGLAVPKLVQLAIDNGIRPGDDAQLIRYGLWIVACGALSAVAFGFWTYFEAVAARRIEISLRERLFAQLQRLHLGYHDQAATGQLMGRMNTDLQQLHAFFANIPNTVAALAFVIGVEAVLLATDACVALLSTAILPVLAVTIAQYRKRLFPVARGLQQELGALSNLVEDTVSGIRVIKGLGAEPVQAQRLRSVANDVYDHAIDWAKLRASYLPIWDFVPALGTIALLWFGGQAVLDGDLTIGELVAFNAYLALLIGPMGHAGALAIVYERALAAASRSAEVTLTEPAIVERPRARALPPGGGELWLDGVSFAYPGSPEPVIRDLSLRVAAGSSVALVGAVGAGKSTLAQLAARLYDVDTGAVRFDGIDVRDLRLRELRRAVGIVFQETFLFTDTVLANIAFGNPEVTEADVARVARLAGASAFIEELPDGYETLLGERGFSLSGGQRQRLAIARTLVTDPRVLILDDATSAVDPAKEHEIRAALSEVMEGRTTMVIAHRPATIALADRVVLLDAGRVVAEGTHAELLSCSPRYRNVLAEERVA